MKTIEVDGITYKIVDGVIKITDLILISNSRFDSNAVDIVRKCNNVLVVGGTSYFSYYDEKLQSQSIWYRETMCEKVTIVEPDSKLIWCLFSVAQDYNQPKHNLECWWTEKPDAFKLKTLCECPLEVAEDLLNRGSLKLSGAYYYLKMVEEGRQLK